MFREEWHEELKRKQQPQSSSVEEEVRTSSVCVCVVCVCRFIAIVSQAVGLYWMGAAAEKSGDMHTGNQLTTQSQLPQSHSTLQFLYSGLLARLVVHCLLICSSNVLQESMSSGA